MKYEKITPIVLEQLKAIVGPKNMLTDPNLMQPYSHDEVTDPVYHHMPEAVVFTESAAQTAAIITLANTARFPVIPRGAGTGLACGAVPTYGGIVLSLEKMNKILEINDDALYAVVEPGVRTSDLQDATDAKGLFYAGDPCSGDSCFIGGNIATNAGGNRAVKYGTTRHQVYAIEVVNPQGKIVQLGARLQKQSTGYCLDQLIIGSEGTLGVITKATLKLLPKPKYALDLLAIFDNAGQAIQVVNKIIKAGILPTCVEFIDNITLKSIEAYLNEKLQGSETGNYLIVEVEGINEDDLDDKAVALDDICTSNGASSVLVADHDKIWQARKAFAEAVRAESLIVCKEDVVVPVDKEPELLQQILILAKKYNLITRIASHAGDGNIHLNILKNPNTSYEDWDARVKENQQELYTLIYQLGGRLSGEHGIGFKRKHLMEEFTNPDELAMMKAVKKALDPNDILNPGKIFDID
ncbi:FAD-binding protein [Megasphaera cerevisiae DSM 20462]|uniref:FAD-binding protein n=1 Tax=Megasphaera cerevisiae DSM 20462 TaxID=1122219 RepID=A0A0J6ZLX2_9FIRM|nr:FAD-binding oxidoreductase [Megasphaera cerevisiae]KMO85881.1 FAD-binding protein [Megasphaera cerevisiae DSM 20462]SJZ57131.1 glycolate oxidase [Megasphaera cerevisiae DSM 20462]